ncbi:tail protein X [Limisalsivibrio acetivorans]|uniref:tail protein X n=1 Tax=Limisalsivibrio acetivorans TaxID=1304888 RepID=UPI0003B446D1|nr:tail protein X [Limisalsivibrio acetivorans]
MRSVITSAGETWDIIARRELGSEKLMHKLLEANPEHADTAVFSGGVQLRIPEASLLPSTPVLPPWRRK